MSFPITGFHLGPGGKKDGLGAWEQSCNVAGRPFFLKCVDEYGPLVEAVSIGNQYGVENYLGFRFTKSSGKVGRETPNYDINPLIDGPALAQVVLANLPKEFDKKVIIELINEPRDENGPDDTMYNNMNACDYLGEWCLAAAKYLNGLGYKFMGPSFNSGRPGRDGKPLSDTVVQYSQPGMLKYLAYCADNPTMAYLSVHEYSWDRWLNGETPDDWYPQLWGRYEAAIAAADLEGIPRTFNILVTEFGFDRNNAPTMPLVESYLNARNQMVARFPQVKGDASWTLQGGYTPVDLQVNTWMGYGIDKDFDPGQQPAATHPEFGSTLPSANPPANCRGEPRVPYHRVVVLLTPAMKTADWLKAAGEATISERWTIGYSADDAGIGDLDEKDVVAINPGDWANGDETALQEFFETYYSGTSYVAINAGSPTDLKAKLLALINGDNNPPTPFTFWPVEGVYRISQVFGANPQNYEQFGLPGHDGIDVPIPTGTPVKAMGPGQIVEVNTDLSKPLGLNVVIQHASSYQSTYAHLSRIDVDLHDNIQAGQQLGLSGETGNADGPHLHFRVKRIGFTYTDVKGNVWPFNLFNPWPLIKHLYTPPGLILKSGYVYDYIVEGSDPEGVSLSVNLNMRTGPGTTYPLIGQVPNHTMIEITGQKQNGYYPVQSWITSNQPAGNAGLGLHASADSGDLSSTEFNTFTEAQPNCIKVLSSHSGPSIARLSNDHPGVDFIIRAFLDFGGRNVSPNDFFNWTADDVDRAINNIDSSHKVWLELHNEPNLASEGLGTSWPDGVGFNGWLLQLITLYRTAFPSLALMYPGLSPQFTGYRPFLADSAAAAGQCDAVAVHCYWSGTYSIDQALADTVDYYVSLFPGKPLWITEASYNRCGITAIEKGNQYLIFWQKLKLRPTVKGVTYFVASASNPAFGWGAGGNCETWVGNEIAAIVGNR